MKQGVDAALDECLAWLRAGVELEACLARVPEHAGELRPLLELAVELRQVTPPAPSPEARIAGEQRMLAALARRPARTRRAGRWERALHALKRALPAGGLRPAWQAAVLLVVALLVLGSGVTVAASAGSLPGDALYPVKMAGHRVQLILTFDPVHRQQLEDSFQEGGREDARKVLAAGRRTSVEFEGELEEMRDGVWVVGGLPATLQDATVISGRPYPGAMVRVRGYLPGNGQILVVGLDVEEEEAPPARTPRPPATAATRTEKPTATEEPGKAPKPTGLPGPTETLRPTRAAQPTETVEPTERPDPTETAKPTKTPRPTQTRDPTETPHPTRTREPTETPHPTQTREPTETPRPTQTREPSETPHQTHTPEPDRTPEPTRQGGKPTDHP
jgi:hypothetical protein